MQFFIQALTRSIYLGEDESLEMFRQIFDPIIGHVFHCNHQYIASILNFRMNKDLRTRIEWEETIILVGNNNKYFESRTTL